MSFSSDEEGRGAQQKGDDFNDDELVFIRTIDGKMTLVPKSALGDASAYNIMERADGNVMRKYFIPKTVAKIAQARNRRISIQSPYHTPENKSVVSIIDITDTESNEATRPIVHRLKRTRSVTSDSEHSSQKKPCTSATSASATSASTCSEELLSISTVQKTAQNFFTALQDSSNDVMETIQRHNLVMKDGFQNLATGMMTLNGVVRDLSMTVDELTEHTGFRRGSSNGGEQKK